MASSQNLASLEPWSFKSSLVDSWFSDFASRDNETLAKALQESISKSATTNAVAVDNVSVPPESISLLASINPEPAQTPTPTLSGVSGGSDPEPTPNSSRNPIPPAGGKISKRKSRASKKTLTTYITADAANFRQMVQQVTGAKFLGGQLSASPILKPEPQRPGTNRLPIPASCLPTLDTSEPLLQHHQQQATMGPLAGFGGSIPGCMGSMSLPYAPPVGVGEVGPSTAGGLDFDALPSFPTLESSFARVVQSGYMTY